MDRKLKSFLQTGRRVVDLGCGSGYLLGELREEFEERIGLDVSRQRLSGETTNAEDDWIFEEADLNSRLPLEDESIDAVIANQVIEHVVDPGKFAGEIYRILRPGGRCVITTPNVRYLKQIAHLLFSGYGPRTGGTNSRDGQWDNGHIHYFTHKDLVDVFQNAGFSNVGSTALIGEPDRTLVRKALDKCSSMYVVREFLSGNLLLWAVK